MASNSQHLLTVVKGLLESEFELSEAAEPSYCLGLEILRDRSHKKNPSVCLLSTKAEYKGLTAAAKEAIWCCRRLQDIGQSQQKPTKIFCDNQGALALSANPVFHARTKHMEVQHHFICDVVWRGEVETEYIHTSQNFGRHANQVSTR